MRKGKIKKFSQKDLKYKKFKLMTKCMLNPNMNSNILEEDTKEFNNTLKYRMFSHILILPEIIKYVNSYLNNLYMFNKYSPKQWIKTFATILRMYNINNTNQLYYPRWKQSPRDNFFKSIRNFNKNTNTRELNLKEMNCVWKLYNSGIITNSEINQIKKIETGQEKVTSKSIELPVVMKDQQEQKIIKPKDKSKQIQIVKNIKNYIANKNTCKTKCSLYGQPNLIFETNIEKASGEVDLMIITFSPSATEITSNGLAQDNWGKAFHGELEKACSETPNFTYVYTNILLCKTSIGDTVTKMKKNIELCKNVINTINDNFKPKYKVLVGANTKSGYGITTAFTKTHRKLIDGNCIVINSPEEVSKDKRKFKRFTESMQYIGNLLKASKKDSIIKNIDLPENQMMERIEKGWVMLDTQVINNEFILYTFTNPETGEKKYHRKEINFPVYIKYGDFRDCDYFSGEINDIVYVTAREKNELSKQLMWNCRRVIKNV